MASFQVFDIAASALSAQSVRLNTVASNLANADSVASTPEGAYHARQPVFSVQNIGNQSDLAGVKVDGVVQEGPPPQKRYSPGHPLADAEGYVYASNVNPVEEMVNLISTARSYQNSIEVMNTNKELMLRTLNLGKGS